VSRADSTASPASGSAIAARSVSSTCPAMPLLTGWPCSRASASTCRLSAASSWLRCTDSALSSAPARFSCASRSRPPSSTSDSISSWCSRTSRLVAQAASEGFGSWEIDFARTRSPSARASSSRLRRAAMNSSGATAYSSSATSSKSTEATLS
jgi:hypothetical protein